MMRALCTLLAGLLGLAFGSFLNVCLIRWPNGESIVHPASHCRSCGRRLAWWENVPLLSWIGLLGRCRSCKAAISWRYPAVELAVALLWMYTAGRAWPQLPAGVNPLPILAYVCVSRLLTMFFLWLMVALLVLDAEHLWLPDFLTIGGTAVGLIGAALDPFALLLVSRQTGIPLTATLEQGRFGLWSPGLHRLGAALCAGGLVLFIRWSYWFIRRREGIGLGDAKLMALLGAWLGLWGAMASFAIGVMLGAVFSLAVLAAPGARRGSESWLASRLPLGTFLCVGGIVGAFFGHPLVRAYLRWIGI